MFRSGVLLLGGYVALWSAACSTAAPDTRAAPEMAPPTTTMVVRHEDQGLLSVLDTARRSVIGTIELAGPIGPVVLSADARWAYVSVPDAIAVVDVAALRTSVTFKVPGNHSGLVQAGDVLYVVDNPANHGRISALDLRTGLVTATRDVDDLARHPAVTPDGRQLFVPHSFYSGRVTALELPRLRVRTVMTFEDGASRLDLEPGPGHVYVPNGNTFDGRLTVVSASTHRSVVDIDLPGEPTDVAVHPDGTRAYVPLFRDHAIGVIDLGSHRLERTIPVRDYPFRLALSADGTCLFVTHNGWDALSVVDTRTSAVGTVPIASPVDFIASPPRFVVR